MLGSYTRGFTVLRALGNVIFARNYLCPVIDERTQPVPHSVNQPTTGQVHNRMESDFGSSFGS